MSATVPCNPCCATTTTTNVPGAAGAAAFTTVSSPGFVIPAADGNVTIPVADTSWMSDGLNLYIGGANFKINVGGVLGPTSVSIKFLNFDGDTAAGSTVASTTLVRASVGGLDFPLSFANGGTGAANRLAAITALINDQLAAVAALTDNSGGTASSTIAAGVGLFTLAIPIQLVAMTTAAADLMTNYTPGFRFKVLAVSFVTTTLGTGAGATQALNFEIDSTNLTGGALTITLATTTPLGVRIDATAITANNIGTASQTLSLEVAAGGTVFTAGAGIILVQMQNLDVADAVASMASKINSLRTALTA